MTDEKEIQGDASGESSEILDLTSVMAQEFGEATVANVEGVVEATEAAFVPATLPELPSFIERAQVKSIIESALFASVHPISFGAFKTIFEGTNVDNEILREELTRLQTDYSGGERGLALEEISGGYQLRTKFENAGWLRRMVKARPFRLSGPALEVLSIVAYKQPLIKSEIDEIRGVESGHLLRALMEKHLIKFAGKSELPGKPMLYATTKQFLELFGLRNIRELPTLSEIDKLIPEGIGESSEIEGETLGSLADKIALAPGKSYSESEAELLSITDALGGISTSSEFFEQEKIREREKRDNERAQDLRERQIVGETLLETDAKWLARFEAKIQSQILAAAEAERLASLPQIEILEETVEVKVEEAPSPTVEVQKTEPSEAQVEAQVEVTAEPPSPKSESRRDVASHAAEAAAAAQSLWDDE